MQNFSGNKEANMKLICKGEMPDGTAIQIEDWREDYPDIFKTYGLAAYPKAKASGKYGWVTRGKDFRLDMIKGWESAEEVLEVFGKLQSGEITLEQLDDHYWNGDRDRYYMGFESVPTEPFLDWRYAWKNTFII